MLQLGSEKGRVAVQSDEMGEGVGGGVPIPQGGGAHPQENFEN